MEEYIAKTWANYISKKSDTGSYENERTFFINNKNSLTLFYHLLGGKKAKELKITDKRPMIKARTLFEKIFGLGKVFQLTWQDEKTLYLPESLAYFPTKKQNELHYFWLVAMLSKIDDNIDDIMQQNQQAILRLINIYSGFEQFYKQAKKYFIFDSNIIINPMWIYPSLTQITIFNNIDNKEPYIDNDKLKNSNTLNMKKKANQLDDEKETDGMLIFLPDSPISFMEMVNVDRTEDDNFDENTLNIAKDLDEITLSRQKANFSSRIKMDLNIISPDDSQYPTGNGHFIDEWHYKKMIYLKDYVHIQPIYKKEIQPVILPARLKKIVKKIQNELDLMQLEYIKTTNLLYGDEININKWIDYKSSNNKMQHTQRFYESYKRNIRDIATFILADTSLSTETGITQETRIIDIIKDSLMVFSEALKRLHDKFAIYTFSSLKNKNVYFQRIKDFEQSYNDFTRGQINNIKSGYYTRLGAGIRESSEILQKQEANNKLLLIISDGKPNDIDRYDGKYGIEDTKKAILEVKNKGIVPFCITIDIETKGYLSYIFGKNGYCVVRDSKKLPKILSEIYINLTK